MKFLFLVVATLALASMTNAQCSNTITCANNNVFNTQSCRCDCFPNYTGTRCETVNCNKADPDQCAAFGALNCVVSFIKGYCPHMCGTCVSSTTGTSTTTTTGTSTTTTTGTSTTTTTGTSTTTTTGTSTTTTTGPSTTTTTGPSTTTTTGPSTTTTTGPSTTTTTGPSTTTTTGPSTTTTTGPSTTTTTGSSTTTTTGPSTTTTTGPSTTTTTGPSTTTTPCQVFCQNGGVLANCACTCPKAYTGSICQNFNCANKADDPSCIFLSTSLCGQDPAIPAICPTKCGVAAANNCQ